MMADREKELGMRTVKVLLITALASLSLVACNTVEGLGKDIKSAGDTIEDAAD
jgi:entericidin B